MTRTRRLAAACAAAALVAGGLALVPAAGSVAVATVPTPRSDAPHVEGAPTLGRDTEAVTAKKRTRMSGWARASYVARTDRTSRTWSFTVRVNGPAKRKVQLQQLVGTTWSTFATGRAGSASRQAFVVRITAKRGTTRVRLRFPATKRYRAAVTATKTFVVTKPSTGPQIPPPPSPPTNPPPDPTASTHYSFLTTTDISSPATAPRWNRCTPVRWSGDFTRATSANGLDRMAEKARWDGVFAEVSSVTGYSFQYVPLADGAGTISGGDVTGFGTQSAAYDSTDIVVTYASPDDAGTYAAADLAGNVIGYGGPIWSTSSAGSRILAGEVLIDYGDVTALNLDTADLRSLYLHELGHALGLGHYSDTAQVMNPFVTTPPVTAYADGDRAGLHALASQTCFTGAGVTALRSTTLR